jgi:hypothetical protein
MTLVPYRKYEVKPEHIDSGGDGRSLQVNLPVSFIRDRTRPGDFIILNVDGDNLDQLVITVSKANGNGTRAGEVAQ